MERFLRTAFDATQTATTELRRAHSLELDRMKDAHASELQLIKDAHASELELIKDAHNEAREANLQKIEKLKAAIKELIS